MRTKFQFSLLFLLIGLFSLLPMSAMANEHYISDVSGLTPEGTIPTDGSTVTFTIGLNNTGPNNITGYTNGFRVYSTTGAEWTATDTASTGAISPSMIDQNFINLFSGDGAGADTVGFGGFRLFAPGIPVGDIPNAYTITIGPVDASFNGGEICIDSSFYPPAGKWTWSTTDGEVYPFWAGPSCYAIGEVVSNNAPVLDPIGNRSVNEGALLTFDATATDADSDPLTFTITTTDLPAGYTFSTAGHFEWTPGFTESGVYTAQVEVTDGTDIDFEIITITVNNVNLAPILNPVGNQNIIEGSNLNFTLTATDPDGDVLSYSYISVPPITGATLDAVSGVFDWTPGFDDAGTYNVTMTVSDGVLTDDEIITITVDNFNQTPNLAAIGNKTTDEGVNLNFTISATDADGDALTYSMTSLDLPVEATFDALTQTFDWTPTFADAGIYSATFRVMDGSAFDEETITITVDNINQSPILDLVGNQTTDENANLSFTATGSDPDADALVFDLINTDLPLGYTFTNGVFDWTPTFDDAGVYTATITLTDGFVTVEEIISITVNDINRTPLLDPIGDQITAENFNLNFTISATDPDGDALTYSMTSIDLPVGATFDILTQTFDWTPTLSDAGVYSATFAATDGLLTAEETITITVNNENQAPILGAIGDQITDEDLFLTFTADATDDDGDALTYEITVTDLPVGYTFTNGVFEWTPTFDDAGVYSATISVTDGIATDEETITITVNNINQTPILDLIGDYSIDEGLNLNFIITGSDPDGDALTYSMTSLDLPAGATFDPVTQTFDWTPTFSDAGAYSATFSVTDGDLTADETITITVNNITQWTINPIGDKTVNENENLNFTVTYANPEAIGLTLTATGIPAGATFAGDIFDWTTTFDDAGVYPVTFSLTDGVSTQEETINITVNNVNRAPSLNAIGDQMTDENALLTFMASGSDPDGDALTFEIIATDLPVGYTFIDGLFEWTPTFDEAGVYTATITANDGDMTAEETITITVNNVNRTPILDLVGDKTVNESANLNFTITGSDPDGDALTYSMLSIDLPVGATFDALTQTFDWTPGLDDAGVYSATFSVTDGTLSDDETISITVANTNQSPVIAVIDDINMTECDYLEITFSAVDPDGDPITLTLTGGNDSMKFVDNGDGTGDLTYNPSYDDAGVYNITLSATDGNTTTEAPFVITMEDCLPPYTFAASLPATVPGSRVAVELSYGNVCELTSLSVQLGWATDMINLDSVSFVGSGIEYLADKTVNIQNGGIRTVDIMANVSVGETNVPAGGGNLATLYFSLDAGIADNIYNLTINDISYTYDCGSGAMTVSPFLIDDGGIAVQATDSYTCGTIIDELGDPIFDATVELWDSYPFAKGTAEAVQTNSFGAFAFDNITIGTFSIYAYKETYYPGIERDLSPPATGLMITLNSVTEVVETPKWMDFYCGTNTLNDVPMPVGSVVDAYTIDDIHVGSWFVTEEGSYGLMPVYGSVAGVADAADLGDIIRFFINGIEAIPSHTPEWTGHGMVDELCLAASYEITQSCTLEEGWNLVSWRTDTPNDQILDVLASIADCIEVVHGFEQGGLTYVPTLPQFSTLNEVDHLSGYWIKISAGCNSLTLDVTGAPVPETTPIALTEGWNLVSYLPEITLPTVDALASINDNIEIAYGFENGGSIYIPNDPLNALDEMSSCHGYWIKVFANDILTYPGSTKAAPLAKIATAKLAADADQKFAKTNNWVSLYSTALTLNGNPVATGVEITALNSDGVTVGSFTIGDNGLFGFMSVYADDPNTPEIDGVKASETFQLVVDGNQTNESFNWTQNGDRIEIAALTTNDIKPLPESYSLDQNYPNPFNPSTNIKFSMAKAGQVKIEVYNILGALVATPFDGQATAGANEITWDGTDRNGKTVSSGIYFYRLTADNYSETKKMTLLK